MGGGEWAINPGGLLYGFEFVLEKPGATFVLKLDKSPHTTTICHFEVFDGADFSQFFDDIARYTVSEAADLNFLTYLH